MWTPPPQRLSEPCPRRAPAPPRPSTPPSTAPPTPPLLPFLLLPDPFSTQRRRARGETRSSFSHASAWYDSDLPTPLKKSPWSPTAPEPLHDVAPGSPGPGLMPAPPRPRQQALTPRPPAWPMTKRPPLLLGRPRLDCSPPAPGPGQLSPWRSLQHTTPVYLLVCLLTFCHSRPNLSPETTGCVRLAPRHVPAPASGAACPRPRSGRGARPRGDGGPCHGGARGAPRPLSGRSHAARLRGRGQVVSLYSGPSNQRQHRSLSTLCNSTSSSAQRDWNRTRCVAATRVKRLTLPKCSGRRLVLCKHSASTC